MTRETIRVHILVSDNRETMSDAENIWLPVDAVHSDDVSDDRKWLCDREKLFASMFT